jgi:DNA-binding IclR family transcriptional regulator
MLAVVVAVAVMVQVIGVAVALAVAVVVRMFQQTELMALQTLVVEAAQAVAVTVF